MKQAAISSFITLTVLLIWGAVLGIVAPWLSKQHSWVLQSAILYLVLALFFLTIYVAKKLINSYLKKEKP